MLQIMEVARSLFLFLLAGLCEIGGGYLIWLYIREGRGLAFALLGAAILVLYGIIPTFQPASFGRVYAAYGGMFIILSILWGWQIDRVAPDRLDFDRRPHRIDGSNNHHVLAAGLSQWSWDLNRAFLGPVFGSSLFSVGSCAWGRNPTIFP